MTIQSPDPPASSQDRGSVPYSDYIKALEDAESARKASLESRGTGTITTSGALVTLLFGLVAVLTGSETFVFPAAARGYLAAAVILFVLATALGIMISSPLFYRAPQLTTEDLKRVWNWPSADAMAKIAVTRLVTIASAKKANTIKAWLLLAAGIVELGALLSLFLAVLAIVN
jgi:hypothetical protein